MSEPRSRRCAAISTGCRSGDGWNAGGRRGHMGVRIQQEQDILERILDILRDAEELFRVRYTRHTWRKGYDR